MGSNRFGAHVVLGVVCVALAVLAGCGGDEGDGNGGGATTPGGGGAATAGGGGDEQALQDTIRDFYGSFQNPAEYCAFLSARLQQNGGRENCEREQQRYADAGATREAKEIKVTVNGSKATAENTVETNSGSVGKSSQQWVKERGEWKIDG